MLKQSLFCFMLGCSVIALASCANKNEPNEDPPDKDKPLVEVTPAPAAKPDRARSRFSWTVCPSVSSSSEAPDRTRSKTPCMGFRV